MTKFSLANEFLAMYDARCSWAQDVSQTDKYETAQDAWYHAAQDRCEAIGLLCFAFCEQWYPATMSDFVKYGPGCSRTIRVRARGV